MRQAITPFLMLVGQMMRFMLLVRLFICALSDGWGKMFYTLDTQSPEDIDVFNWDCGRWFHCRYANTTDLWDLSWMRTSKSYASSLRYSFPIHRHGADADGNQKARDSQFYRSLASGTSERQRFEPLQKPILVLMRRWFWPLPFQKLVCHEFCMVGTLLKKIRIIRCQLTDWRS